MWRRWRLFGPLRQQSKILTFRPVATDTDYKLLLPLQSISRAGRYLFFRTVTAWTFNIADDIASAASNDNDTSSQRYVGVRWRRLGSKAGFVRDSTIGLYNDAIRTACIS
jgi:hypothetical protein